MEAPNNRTRLWSQSLELMDEILLIGTIERFAWAGATAASNGDPVEEIVNRLDRAELKKYFFKNNDLYMALEAIKNIANHTNFFNLAMEANQLVIDAYAKRLGIHDAFICLGDGISPINTAQKISNGKLKLLKGEK